MKPVEKPPRDVLIKLYYDEHKTVFEIGNKYGCPYVTVLKWFKEYEIPRRVGWGGSSRSVKKPPTDVLIKLYYDEHKTLSEIGKIYDRSTGVVTKWFKEYGIPRRGGWGRNRSSVEKPPRDVLIKLYYDEHKTLSEIGKIYDRSTGVVTKWFNSYELPRRSRGDYGMNPLVFPLIRSHPVHENIDRDDHQSLRDAIECSGRDLRSELIKWYYDEHKTLLEIGEIYGCSDATVLNWFKNYNLPRRKTGGRRINPDPYAEKKKKKPVVKHISYSHKGTCTILREHAHDLEDDPERLSTDFLQKMLGKKCK